MSQYLFGASGGVFEEYEILLKVFLQSILEMLKTNYLIRKKIIVLGMPKTLVGYASLIIDFFSS